MTESTSRELAAKAVNEIRQSGAAGVQAVCALMRAKLAEAREELEEAGDDRQIFRAQGRAQLARDILGALTRESA
ncbi:MAG: hypothetical protein LUG19_12625 [Desulfovibrio sp.]|uniref:hypothetical protein n=1 Tax=Desulfovibrio sp. TaxID=885 RepID=UPI002582F1DA|nr:hypothetical protein [Desulfovibrio sp.]MCD7985075.1 hypothetical protein [Desulfovibrio sp.]